MLDHQSQETSLCFVEQKAKFDAGDFDGFWSPQTKLKIRGSINKAPRVFKEIAGISDPYDIPMSETAILYFADEFLKSKTFPDNCGFKKYESFKVFVANVLSFICNAIELQSPRPKREADDWDSLLVHLSGEHVLIEPLAQSEAIMLGSFAERCRKLGVMPGEVTASTFHEVAKFDKSKTKNRLAGLGPLFDKYHGANTIPANLLPKEIIGPLDDLATVGAKPIFRMHPEYERRMGKFLDYQKSGHISVMFGKKLAKIQKRGASKSRLKNLGVALKWFWRMASEIGAVSDAKLDSDVIFDPSLMCRVLDHATSDEHAQQLAPDTLRTRMYMVIEFLDSWQPGFKITFPTEFFEDKRLKKGKSEVSCNVSMKRRTCLKFIRDPEMQKNFFTMPVRAYDIAAPLIEKFHLLGNGNTQVLSRRQYFALDMAAVAVISAIGTRFPLRLDTIQQLVAFGPRKNLIFPDDLGRQNTVILDIPSYMTKNGVYFDGVPIEATASVNARQIITWFLNEVHPLFMKSKARYAKQAHMLFGGVNIEVLRQAWKRAQPHVNFHCTAHMTRHLLGSLLFHQGVPIEEVAELLGHK